MTTISASAPVVQATGLWKRFGDVTAVQDVSLSVRPGEIIGLVGPNGAGKTTTIRMLLDITQPDEGEVSVFGASMNPDARERIGYLPEERGLYRSLRIIPIWPSSRASPGSALCAGPTSSSNVSGWSSTGTRGSAS